MLSRRKILVPILNAAIPFPSLDPQIHVIATPTYAKSPAATIRRNLPGSSAWKHIVVSWMFVAQNELVPQTQQVIVNCTNAKSLHAIRKHVICRLEAIARTTMHVASLMTHVQKYDLQPNTARFIDVKVLNATRRQGATETFVWRSMPVQMQNVQRVDGARGACIVKSTSAKTMSAGHQPERKEDIVSWSTAVRLL